MKAPMPMSKPNNPACPRVMPQLQHLAAKRLTKRKPAQKERQQLFPTHWHDNLHAALVNRKRSRSTPWAIPQPQLLKYWKAPVLQPENKPVKASATEFS